MAERDTLEALRPFAIFALETRMPEDGQIVWRHRDEVIAALSGRDFHHAYAAYANADDLCLQGAVLTGGEGGRMASELRETRNERASWLARHKVGLWCLFFFVLGILAGGAQ